MAKKIILLERMRNDDFIDLRICFWLDVPLANRVPNTDAKTSFSAATPDELAALRSGAVAEVSKRMTWPKGTTVQTIRGDLVIEHTRLQGHATAVNLKQYYGAYWDGTAWHAAGT